jgi:hypothetical protein
MLEDNVENDGDGVVKEGVSIVVTLITHLHLSLMGWITNVGGSGGSQHVPNNLLGPLGT